MDAWMGGGSLSGSKRLAVPISRFQSGVLLLLAAQRSPGYVAGGIAINRQGPRFSGDIDIFHDSAARQASAVTADEAALAPPDTKSPGPPQRTGTHEATIEKHGEQMQLEWVTDSAFRFFPTQQDEPGAPSGLWPSSPDITRAMLERYGKPKP